MTTASDDALYEEYGIPRWLQDRVKLAPAEKTAAPHRYVEAQDDHYTPVPIDDALYMASASEHGGSHYLIFDCDHPVWVRETSPGRWHIAIKKNISRSALQGVLHALANAGIVESGYELMTLVRPKFGATLRWPWVKKGVDKPLSAQIEETRNAS